MKGHHWIDISCRLYFDYWTASDLGVIFWLITPLDCVSSLELCPAVAYIVMNIIRRFAYIATTSTARPPINTWIESFKWSNFATKTLSRTLSVHLIRRCLSRLKLNSTCAFECRPCMCHCHCTTPRRESPTEMIRCMSWRRRGTNAGYTQGHPSLLCNPALI